MSLDGIDCTAGAETRSKISNDTGPAGSGESSVMGRQHLISPILEFLTPGQFSHGDLMVPPLVVNNRSRWDVRVRDCINSNCRCKHNSRD